MSRDILVIKEYGYTVELSNGGGLRKENPAPANLQKRDMRCLFTGCQKHTTNKSGLCTKHNKLFDDYNKRRKTKEFKNQPIERRNRLDDQWPGLIHSKDWLGRLITPGKTREDCLTDAPRHSDITEALVNWMNKSGSGRIKKMDAFIQDVLKRVVGNVPDATTLQKNVNSRIRGTMTPKKLVKMTKDLVIKHFPKNEFGRTKVDFGRYKQREIKDLPIRVAAALLVLAYACEEANRGDFWFSRRHPSYKPRRGSAYMPSVYYFLRRHTNANKEQARMCLKS